MLKYRDIFSYNRPDDTLIAIGHESEFSLADFRAYVLLTLAELQKSPQKEWLLVCNDSFWFSVGLFALLYCNKVPVIPGNCRSGQLYDVFSQNYGLLTDREDLDYHHCIRLDLLEKDRHLATTLSIVSLAIPADAYVILYTSGSTGTPKAVKKTLRGLELESELLYQRWFTQLSDCQLASTVSHQHLYGLTFRILLPLSFGIPFETQQIDYHEQLLKARNHPIVLISSPAFLKRLDTSLKNHHCRAVFSAGGPIDFQAAQNTQRCFGQLPTEIYGTTETGVIATRQQLTTQSCWSPIGPITISEGEHHEIRVNSPLFSSIEDNPKDRIKMTEEGFHLLGRDDRIVKIEEKRISLTEIEKQLTSITLIQEVAITLIVSHQRTHIAAVVQLSPEGINTFKKHTHFSFCLMLRKKLLNWIEPVAIPRFWRFVEMIPCNPQGKTPDYLLQELFQNEVS